MATSSDYREWSGRSHGWRYLAQSIDGSGNPGAWIDNELPLQSVKYSDVLSGPMELSGYIEPVILRDKYNGQPVFSEWGTVIHVEADGAIRGSFILDGMDMQKARLVLDCVGYSGYAKGMPYSGAQSYSHVEALDIVRAMWDDIQNGKNSDLGMAVDPWTRTGVLVGGDPAPAASATGTASQTDTTTASSGTSTDEKPYELNWWSTDDLGGEIDKLAEATPFDYHERHQWNSDHTVVNHYLDFGYPTLGRRRDNLRFIYGENIFTEPDPSRNYQDFANHVVCLGAGEGSQMVRGEARSNDNRLRRVAHLEDKSITDNSRAAWVAHLQLQRLSQNVQLSGIAIRNTPSAAFGSFGVGDEIRVQASTPWQDYDMWVRITRLSLQPDSPDLMTADVFRSDWVS